MSRSQFRWTVLILMVALAAGTGCRPVPPVKQGTATPASESAPIPEVYQFLAHPGVGIESVDSLWARLPYDSISLRRDPCFGTCPMYDATLYRGGAARYHGIRFVDQVGGFKGEITLQDYGRLNYLLDRLEFMALPDSFAAAATDLPGMTLTAHRRPEGFKSVHDYGYVGPVELWTLGQVFDGILNRVQWEKTGP